MTTTPRSCDDELLLQLSTYCPYSRDITYLCYYLRQRRIGWLPAASGTSPLIDDDASDALERRRRSAVANYCYGAISQVWYYSSYYRRRRDSGRLPAA